MPKKASYWDYVRVEELLGLQRGVDASEEDLSNDEVRFIVIHQIDELWFKLVLRELAAARDLFAQELVPEDALAGAAQNLKRVTICFELAAQHFRLMETMRTQDYLTFRDKLNPASGFQSAQMREIEILMGLDDAERIPFGKEGSYLDALKNDDGTPSSAHARVTARLADQPTLKEAVYGWLQRTPINGSAPGAAGDEDVVAAWSESYYQGHGQLHDRALQHAVRMQALSPEDESRLRSRYDGQLRGARRHLDADDAPAELRAFTRRLRAAILFVDSNRSLPLLSWPGAIIDGLIECEQAMLAFRQRHARMVERVIGRRVGTGGSDGVAYLDQTALEYRVFTEIWAGRTLLLPPELSPPPQSQSFYGLSRG
ncbi:MAG: tryptophan 2,3-dioxygenase family protein [Planctomycetota bacterium]|nr:tryptophan 2,3-dioxygenase family protein [Planctomycetota bacterium]